MTQEFYKYHGCGNDFIIIDNRTNTFDKSDPAKIAELCHRRFGIGADGLILLEDHETLDFKMVYYNSDGNQSSMCGNGGRCITHFAHYLNLLDIKATFEAIDGVHHSILKDDVIRLQMQNVSGIGRMNNDIILNTGSPHIVRLVDDLAKVDIDKSGAELRYSETFKDDGINVNFVEKINDENFKVRTYERGVEAETLSCGTGVTAVAIAMNFIGETEKNLINLKTPGGDLQVSFEKRTNAYIDIWLVGPAVQVYKGEITW
ncbi:MAG: diaminopimelate epimerase [Flavobacteriaceae bacterium]|nr:diaminopimelate epimerase [Flavobacteriaceae bacterium]